MPTTPTQRWRQFLHEQGAYADCQKVVRGFLARQRVGRIFRRREAAAVLFQRHWLAFRARVRVRKLLIDKVRAEEAVVQEEVRQIQREREARSALVIQALWRGHRVYSEFQQRRRDEEAGEQALLEFQAQQEKDMAVYKAAVGATSCAIWHLQAASSKRTAVHCAHPACVCVCVCACVYARVCHQLEHEMRVQAEALAAQKAHDEKFKKELEEKKWQRRHHKWAEVHTTMSSALAVRLRSSPTAWHCFRLKPSTMRRKMRSRRRSKRSAIGLRRRGRTICARRKRTTRGADCSPANSGVQRILTHEHAMCVDTSQVVPHDAGWAEGEQNVGA